MSINSILVDLITHLTTGIVDGKCVSLKPLWAVPLCSGIT
jgi:hypothetical protein